ncbi:HAD family hydrolase [Glaciimonas immobilis]|uniref:HAD superfamily hydrolase (TIGR01509 family) n=1 Tax=Glaciimonas immobilis TaxID=728004 RepID=A0A840RPS8_9BURK|nr:hypothetical protein [Glaciimonas immobilis]KAF3999897.1 hypothetical protein HAV38_01585 [Glaciimonas immobilis]MBB5200387.1 HAD superfamily hydrolase (TIGR01509 family) [Glaciimonas immobilis]
MPNLVCFDLGNVLVRLRPSMRSVVRREDQPQLAALLNQYCLGNISSPDFFAQLGLFFPLNTDPATLRQRFVKNRLLGLYKGASTLLCELHDQAVPVALLSNINEAHWDCLKSLRALNQCHYRLLSFRLRCQKPDDKIFRCLENISGYSGNQIIFFDDLMENIQAARRRGWCAWKVDPDTSIEGIRERLHDLNVL